MSAKISLFIFASISEAPKPDMVTCDPYEACMLSKSYPTPKHRIKTEAGCLGASELIDDGKEFFRCDFGFDKIGVDTALHSQA